MGKILIGIVCFLLLMIGLFTGLNYLDSQNKVGWLALNCFGLLFTITLLTIEQDLIQKSTKEGMKK